MVGCGQVPKGADWRWKVSGFHPWGFYVGDLQFRRAWRSSPSFNALSSVRSLSPQTSPWRLRVRGGAENACSHTWRTGGAYRACNLTCAMTRLFIPPPSQNTTDEFPNNPNNSGPGHDPKLTSWLRASYQDSIQALVFGRR